MSTPEEFARMKEVVETISHYAQIYHNGNVELVSFDGEHVRVKMGGCKGNDIIPNLGIGP